MQRRSSGSGGGFSISQNAWKNTGVPGNTVAFVLAKSSSTARGVRSRLKTIGTPRAINGVSKLLKPYECEIGITPKLRSTSAMPIVSQIWSQSAKRFSLRKRIIRGAEVVPEVSLKSVGGWSPHSVIPLFAAIERAAPACSSVIASSIGRSTRCVRKHARKNEAQSG